MMVTSGRFSGRTRQSRAQGRIVAMDVNAARLRPLNEAAKQQGLAHLIQTKVRQLLPHIDRPLTTI